MTEFIDTEGTQPCGYCWGFTPPGGWDMENIDRYIPRGDGWIGLAPIHERCQEQVDAYMNELARERLHT